MRLASYKMKHCLCQSNNKGKCVLIVIFSDNVYVFLIARARARKRIRFLELRFNRSITITSTVPQGGTEHEHDPVGKSAPPDSLPIWRQNEFTVARDRGCIDFAGIC
jgi:hypothetical protein